MRTNFVYHIRPDRILGEFLYPLHRLRQLDDQLYLDAIEKYRGREEIMKVRVPILDCLWNEFVPLSPIHPSIIRRQLESFGLAVDSDRKWIRIPAGSLESLSGVYFEHPPT